MVSILKTDKIQASHGSTIEIPSGHVLHQPGAILQVAEGEFNTQTDISSTSYTDTSLTVTITPKFASSKVFVITNLHMYINGTGLLGLNVVRGSTQIVEAQKAVGYQDNTSSVATLTKLDSPNTTSATTYKVQVKHYAATGTMRINQQDGGSRITVMEIAQ